jgi:transcriptional regulator with XRE-family HTH domain
MKHTIHTAADLGQALRAVRRSAKVRLDDLAQTVGVSKQTTTNVEQGKPTVALGTIIQLLAEMGLTLSVDLPESALPELQRIRERAQEALETRADTEAFAHGPRQVPNIAEGKP